MVAALKLCLDLVWVDPLFKGEVATGSVAVERMLEKSSPAKRVRERADLCLAGVSRVVPGRTCAQKRGVRAG